MPKNLSYIPKNKIVSINRYLELIKSFFLSENSYPFSSKWSHFHLYNLKCPVPFDIIKYPSVVNKKTLNFAIHPSFFDKYYKLKRVFEINLVSQVEPQPHDKNFIFELLNIGLPHRNSNKILFREAKKK